MTVEPNAGFHVVIPARFGATRLPGKPLADISGRPMVVRVADAARRSTAAGVWVATDDQRVVDAAGAHRIDAIMTRADHASGSDRIAEVADRFGWADSDIVVNVQGDEPLLDPALIDAVAAALDNDPGAAMATVAHPLGLAAEFFDPNCVKVVCDRQGRALYFSRAPIPWDRDGFAASPAALGAGLPALRHVGLYAYRVGFLRRFGQLDPSPLERCESLEQLRALWHGFAIRVVIIDQAPPGGVDTPADLDRVRRLFDASGNSE